MAELGKHCTLDVVSFADFGIYLDGGELGDILLPRKEVPDETLIGDRLEVFLYHDSQDRLIATRAKPLGEVGRFAFLRCQAVMEFGSFLDWGLPRGLFVPFREQKTRMVEGVPYVVRIYEDDLSHRVAGTTKFHRFLDPTPAAFSYNMEVELLILHRMELGYVAIVDDRYQGVIYHSEVFRDLRKGDRCKGYVKCVRDDGKLDLALQPQGYRAVDPASELILQHLRDHGGVMAFTDDSDPGAIYQAFGISKKQFKKALGLLLKKGSVAILPNKVTLLDAKA